MSIRRTSAFFASILILFFAAAQAADTDVTTLAHIKLSGTLDETPIGDDPLFGAGGENFRSKLERIKKAKKDPAIQGLVLQIDGIQCALGQARRTAPRDLRFPRRFKQKTFACLESGQSIDYLAAIACDEICVPEGGWLMLVGMRMEVTFYKDLFEKIGVKADMLQMGDFKGAAEPYTRSGMSPQFRKQLEFVLDDYFEKSFIGPIAESRAAKHWQPAQVKALVDAGPYTAKAALAAGLIDRVGYTDELTDAWKKEFKTASVKVVKNYGQSKSKDLDFSNPFALFSLFAPTTPPATAKPKVAVIYAVGSIASGKAGAGLLGGQTVGSTTMIDAIRQAEADASVKAIVLRVDSPGGSALASDLIWNELSKSKKPLIASMSDVAASGGYYISMAANKIYAEPGTLTGSIGVVGGKLVVGGLETSIGLKTETISRGANSGILSSDSIFNEAERKAMTALMRDCYEQFLDKALKGRAKAGREMTLAQLENLAAGRVWTGRQARENGLVDELGTLDDAVAAARKMAKMADTETDLLILPKPVNLFDALTEMKGDVKLPALSAPQFPILRLLPDLAEKLRGAEGLLQLRAEPVWVVMPEVIRVH